MVDSKEMADEIDQLEVKEIPKECPVCKPCPVLNKPKPWQICLRAFLLLIFGLVLAFIILAASGLRITRKESLLDVWLASRKGVTPTLKAIEPTPTPDPFTGWKTYTNTEYEYELKYPPEMNEFEQPKSFYTDEIPHSFNIHNIPSGLGPDTVENPDNVRNFGINYSRNSKGLTLENFIKNNHVVNSALGVKLTPKQYGNLSGIFYAIEMVDGQIREEFAVEKDDYVIQFTGIDSEEGIKILSTFKFLDKNQSEPVVIDSPDLTGTVKSP